MIKIAAATIGIAATLAGAGVALAGPVSTSTTATAPAARPALLEMPDCNAVVAPPDGAAAASSSEAAPGGGMSQTITVTVPRLAIIRLDASGGVASAMTNTGCAPRPADDVYLVDAFGTFVNEDPAHELPDHVWVGDFTRRGVYQPQIVAEDLADLPG
jgi:hypothetical protein